MASNGPLSPMALRGLERLADVIIPGDDDFPSYSQSGCIEHVNEIAALAPEDDIKLLGTFLCILSLKPKFALRMLCSLMMSADKYPEFMAVPLRQLNIGLRGLIVSPYFGNLVSDNYSGKTPHDVMGYELNRLKD